MDPLSPNQQLLVLEADIGAKTRELTKATEELENLNRTKAEAFKQHDIQIRKKKDEVEALQAAIDKLNIINTQLSAEQGQLTTEVAQIKSDKLVAIADAESAVKTIHETAQRREEAVTDREANVAHREEQIKVDQAVVDGELSKLQVEQGRVNEIAKSIEIDRIKLQEQVTLSEATVAKNKEISDDISRQIATKKMELLGLDTEIEKKTETAKAIGIEANERLTRVKTREILVAGREKGQDAKDIIQNKREHWLDDREATVGRAYRETINRGGRVAPPPPLN